MWLAKEEDIITEKSNLIRFLEQDSIQNIAVVL